MNNKKMLKLKLEFCAIAVIFFVVLLTSGLSFGWFSNNRNVKATGMNVQANAHSVMLEYRVYDESEESWTSWTKLEGSAFDIAYIRYPGNNVLYQVRIKNTSSEAIDIKNIGFERIDLTVDELPRIIGEERYYFGTQITADCLYTTSDDSNDYKEYPSDGTYTEEATPSTYIFDDETMDTSRLYFYNNYPVSIDVDETIVFCLEFKFVNETFSQDAFKKFGESEDEVCIRRIVVDFS